MKRDLSFLLLFLSAAGVILLGTSVKGVFIVDELNYMVTAIGLSHGSTAVPGTENLPPSKELYYFDPEANQRTAVHGPVISLVPPLYAPIAVPFVFLGWYGLVLINLLSFLATTAVIFLTARRYSTERVIPWLAAALFFFGGYGIEYAQGVWPHMLASFLCASAVFFVSYAWNGDARWEPFLAGLLAGISTGIREQNIFLAFCIGCTALFFGRNRLRSSLKFALGLAIPILVIVLLNFNRYGSLHPFPKAIHYQRQVQTELTANSPLSRLGVFWAKVVDFSAQPPITDQNYFFDRENGTILVGPAVKKALLQSSPWIGLTFVVLVIAWVRKKSFSEQQTVLLRGLSFLILPTLAMFTLAGYGRMDGMASNQRYFHELVPLAALGAALCVDGLGVEKKYLFIGCLLSFFVFVFFRLYSSWHFWHLVLVKGPLILAFLVIFSWFLRSRLNGIKFLSLAIGLCAGWSFSTHMGDDLVASRRMRSENSEKLEKLDSIIPDHSGVFVYRGAKDGAGPLQLHKDVVILDTWADEGKEAVVLKNALRRQGRRIFIVEEKLPSRIFKEIAGGDSLIPLLPQPYRVYEATVKK